MRAWFGYIFIVLVSTFWAASPVLAAAPKTAHSARVTVVQTPRVECHSPNQHCDQPEDTEVITATYNQYNAYGPVVLTNTHGFNARVYPVTAISLATGRNNTRIQPFYQLILFPFHVFW